MNAADATVHHLVTASDWQACCDDLHYRPPSLAAEGFIHLSAPDQVARTVARFYADVEDLLVISIDAAAIDDLVVWEDLMGHGAFPHCYGPLPLTAVMRAEPYG